MLLGGVQPYLVATSDGWRSWTGSTNNVSSSHLAMPCGPSDAPNDAAELIAPSPRLLYLYCALETGVNTELLRVFRSRDGGHTWQLLTARLPAGFYADSDPTARVFAATSPSNLLLQGEGLLIHSSDGGRIWRVVSPQGLEVSPSLGLMEFSGAEDGVLFDEADNVSTFGWWATRDGGQTWKRTNSP